MLSSLSSKNALRPTSRVTSLTAGFWVVFESWPSFSGFFPLTPFLQDSFLLPLTVITVGLSSPSGYYTLGSSSDLVGGTAFSGQSRRRSPLIPFLSKMEDLQDFSLCMLVYGSSPFSTLWRLCEVHHPAYSAYYPVVVPTVLHATWYMSLYYSLQSNSAKYKASCPSSRMSRCYSREEKGKKIEEDHHLRKPLVRVPENDVTELIERNKFTLIGRVTNPAIQKTRALVDFFLQQWHVVGRITWRDLGPSLFQFCFESEKDLQTILAKAPFHFKNWMFILKKWEPVVSDSFPAIIPFWVRAHGIPLHYWMDGTIDAIGATLGPIVDREVDKARFRVHVNGLKPLIMKLDLQLPSRKVVEVEVEYEKLGKHCFFCKSLTHEDTEKHPCPLSRAHAGNRGSLGITQQNTLEHLEDGRRRQEERRFSRQQNRPDYK